MAAEVLPDSRHQASLEVCDPAEVHNPAESARQSVNSLARFAASSETALAKDVFSGSVPVNRNNSRPKSLLLEAVRNGDGMGPVVDLDDCCGKLLVVTLGITDVVERTGLNVSVWGSSDQNDWGAKPLVTFRQRQYCGVYSMLLNMAQNPSIRWLRVQWNMKRWGKGERAPTFGFQVFLEESGARVSGAAVA